MTDQEVPEVDAVEQALPVDDGPAALRPSADPEAPEADAIDQALVEDLDEEQGRR